LQVEASVERLVAEVGDAHLPAARIEIARLEGPGRAGQQLPCDPFAFEAHRRERQRTPVLGGDDATDERGCIRGSDHHGERQRAQQTAEIADGGGS
jgi:hypothetical protein